MPGGTAVRGEVERIARAELRLRDHGRALRRGERREGRAEQIRGADRDRGRRAGGSGRQESVVEALAVHRDGAGPVRDDLRRAARHRRAAVRVVAVGRAPGHAARERSAARPLEVGDELGASRLQHRRAIARVGPARCERGLAGDPPADDVERIVHAQHDAVVARLRGAGEDLGRQFRQQGRERDARLIRARGVPARERAARAETLVVVPGGERHIGRTERMRGVDDIRHPVDRERSVRRRVRAADAGRRERGAARGPAGRAVGGVAARREEGARVALVPLHRAGRDVGAARAVGRVEERRDERERAVLRSADVQRTEHRAQRRRDRQRRVVPALDAPVLSVLQRVELLIRGRVLVDPDGQLVVPADRRRVLHRAPERVAGAIRRSPDRIVARQQRDEVGRPARAARRGSAADQGDRNRDGDRCRPGDAGEHAEMQLPHRFTVDRSGGGRGNRI